MRLDRKSLVATSIALLLLNLAVLWLFHMRTVNGWSQSFYEARVPWLASPIALALIVLLTRRDLGARNAFAVAGTALVAAFAAAYVAGAGGYAMVLSLVTLLAALYKMWKIHGLGLPVRYRLGGLLLWLGAVLDLVFWVNPPTHVGLPGLVLVHLPWPIQVPGVVLAFLAIWGAHRIWLARAPRHAGWIYILVAIMGAYYIAPLLALAAWFLHRRDLAPRPMPARVWRTPAVYGIHLLVAIVFVGYSGSTYFGDEARGTLTVDGSDTLAVGPWLVSADDVDLQFQDGRVQELHAHLSLLRDGEAEEGPAPELYWEPQTGSYYPLPATHRTWNQDIYANIDAICTDPTGDCTGTDWTSAYQPTRQAADGLEVSQVRVQMHTLPGIGLLWTALVGFPGYLLLLMRGDPLASKATGQAADVHAHGKTPNRDAG